jgi:hypothetical protein
MGICPARKMKPPHLTACEYGPTGLGAFSVNKVCLSMKATPFFLFKSLYYQNYITSSVFFMFYLFYQ